jgi:hypothetical protein
MIQKHAKWYRNKSRDTVTSQVIEKPVAWKQNPVTWNRNKPDDTETSYVIQKQVTWYRNKPRDTVSSQVNQKPVTWNRNKSRDTETSHVKQKQARWNRNKSRVNALLIRNFFLQARRLTRITAVRWSKFTEDVCRDGWPSNGWQCAGPHRLIWPTRTQRRPPPIITRPVCPLLSTRFQNRSHEGAVSRMSLKFGNNGCSSYTPFQNVTSSDVSSTGGNTGTVIYTRKWSTLQVDNKDQS